MELIKPEELFSVYMAGEQGATIIQVNYKEKLLRKVNTNMLPCSLTMIPLSIDEWLIAPSIGIKVCNTNRDYILYGNDIDVVLMEFTPSQVTYALCIPVENCQCLQYRIEIMVSIKFNKKIWQLMEQSNFHLNQNLESNQLKTKTK
ncbi:unnamed protein product (macronuclear) [Paramecium tetraurelia]|uniref:Uncharacterized protein n=1 Tax=Paramecium tetraurelia TaxID=5888 RepID=A0BIW3_PARTE|nr:uncharacterized protein GSPATT00004853001 [Paramecium tetraurelia]CAK58480.1 unnamed protein product [Paramecium tetraurelia]|eukprot:XP_001425878.1 hypothetical protein (macronuclear) [Paramecium tetraurelia strain d4-2]